MKVLKGIFYILKGIFYTFLTAFLLILFYFFFGGVICNDIKASHIEKEYAVMELPEKTRQVSTVSYIGNTSGMGKFIEIWAGMVVYSELSAEELEEFFDGYYVVELPVGVETMDVDDWIANNYSVELYPITTNICEKFFSSLEEPISGEGYFVINQFYDAFTQWDFFRIP